MAMMASNGPEAVVSAEAREVKSVVEDPSRSPAPRVEVVLDWTWEAEKSLFAGALVSALDTQRGALLRDCYRKFPGSGHGLDDYIGFFDAGGEKLGLCAGEKGLDDCCGERLVRG